jgi:putative transposase
MPRRPRLVISGLPHHVTQRGNNKQNIFLDENDYLKYLVRFEEYRKNNHLAVISFCLMPNHVHFVAIPNN